MSAQAKELVIFVDDDAVTLNLLVTSFKQKWGAKYQYEKAESAPEAEEIIAEALKEGKRPVLVISDYHMPDKMGDSFLIELGQQMPDVPLFLHSGLADNSTVNHIKKHCPSVTNIPKPWNNDSYLTVIDQALQP